MPKDVISCMSLDDFQKKIDRYLSLWVSDKSIFVNRSEILQTSFLYYMTVLEVCNNNIIYRYTFDYNDDNHTMTYLIELAHFE